MQSVCTLCTILSAVRTGPSFVAMRKHLALTARAPMGELIMIQTVARTNGEKNSGDRKNTSKQYCMRMRATVMSILSKTYAGMICSGEQNFSKK